MKFVETSLPGAFVLELERIPDERGYFARTFCRAELTRHGLDARVEQTSVSYNRAPHTLRGMHYQAVPHEEAKLVRCVAGAIHDVIVDLRPSSPAYRRWFAVELTAEALNALYVPPGFAHGFVTLTADAVVQYQMSVGYEPAAARGLRWDDPALGIRWPVEPRVISERDATYPLLETHHG